jgi:hypothetical protein
MECRLTQCIEFTEALFNSKCHAVSRQECERGYTYIYVHKKVPPSLQGFSWKSRAKQTCVQISGTDFDSNF